MNGRIYDPLVGRMLSADVVVQNPGSLQDFNRYSYVKNNPLTLTDPTGFIYDNIPLKDDVAAQYLGTKMAEGIADSYNSGKAHAEAGMQEFSNASNSSTPGLDRTIAGLHMVAMVGAAVDTTMAVTPEGKAEKVSLEAVEKVATKAESVVAKAVSKAEGTIATAERKVEGVAKGLESEVSKAVPTAKAKSAGERMAEVRAKGAQGEAQQVEKIRAEGESVTGSQVTVETSTGTRTRIDKTTTDGQKTIAREAKKGENARLSQGQKDLKADTEAGRPVTPRGNNAKRAGFDGPTTFDEFKEDRF